MGVPNEYGATAISEMVSKCQKHEVTTLITFTVLFWGWWYWYEYQPQKIKEECGQFTTIASAANLADNENQASGDAFLKVSDQFQKACVDAGGVANFKNALDAGQSYNQTE